MANGHGGARDGAGRPSDLTPAVQERICNFLRGGSYVETAALAAGVSKRALYEWLSRGGDAKLDDDGNAVDPKMQRYVDFVVAVDQALAESEIRDIERIDKAADTTWQAAAWKLERKWPEKYGVKQRIEHTGAGGGPISITDLVRKAEDEQSGG